MSQVLKEILGGHAIVVIAMGVLEQQDEVVIKGTGSRPAGVGGGGAGDLGSLAA